MRRESSVSVEEVHLKIPRRLSGRKLVLVEAGEYARLKRRVAELDDAVARIRRGDEALRNGRTRKVGSLAELDD